MSVGLQAEQPERRHTSAPLAAALTAAARVIAAVQSGASADAALAEQRLTGPLLAATRDLAWGALRRFGRDAFYLGRLMPRPLRDDAIHALLLAALYRLHERPEDAHTTVDQAVRAAAGMAQGKYRALTNAVLRNFLRQREELETAAGADEVACHQHPAWWLTRLRRDWPEQWRDIAAAGNGRAPMCLRVNRRQGDAAAYLARLDDAGISARALDETAVLLDKPVGVDALPGFDEGAVSVQDWGAQRAAALLGAQDGMRVLDACAAPGGESGHVLETAQVELTALDNDAVRAERVRQTLVRLGFVRAAGAVQSADCRRLDAWWDGRPYARILLDAPCSGSGVVRRHPDAKWLRRASDVALLAHRQDEMLDALWRALAPDGRMLYCTCSVFDAENSARVAAFLSRRADARLLFSERLAPAPEHDGFYYALLAKDA